jgi:hypothetical protein
MSGIGKKFDRKIPFFILFSPSSATILAATHKRSFDSREGPTFAIA